MNHDLENIAKTLIELWGYEHDTPKHEARFWAWEALNDFVRVDPKQAWNTILKVLELTDSDRIIDCLGAGFLEHLMCDHDRVTMDSIVSELPKNEKLAKCMSSVWLSISDTQLYREFYELIDLEPPFGDEE